MESISKITERLEFERLLLRALALEMHYTERTDFSEGKSAAVLALWAMSASHGPLLLLTQRTETLEVHRGQIAFPGGGEESGDLDSSATALRESEEEVGLVPAEVIVLGVLPKLWTVTGFQVTPVVAIHSQEVEKIRLTPNPQEIAESFWVSLAELRGPGVYSEEPREWRGRVWRMHVYQVGKRRIWGATAAMIKNLLDRLEALR